MIEGNKTVTASRTDLAALEVNPPIGFIGSKIYPVSKVGGKAGTYYYAALTADAAAQTSRSPGAAPTAVTLAESSSTFSATELIKRYKVPYEAVPLFGGVAGSDRVGGKAAKRSVMRALETAQLAAAIDGAGTSITSAIIDGIAGAANAVRLYSGRMIFACSMGQYRWLVTQDEIKNLLLRTFNVGGADMSSVLSVRPDVFKSMLQGLFMFDDVFIGDDLLWPQAYYTTAMVAKVADGSDAESYLMEPELGRTMIYWPEGSTTEFEVNSFPDDDVRGNIYDATVWQSIEQMNSGAKSLVTLSSQATTTTTT